MKKMRFGILMFVFACRAIHAATGVGETLLEAYLNGKTTQKLVHLQYLREDGIAVLLTDDDRSYPVRERPADSSLVDGTSKTQPYAFKITGPSSIPGQSEASLSFGASTYSLLFESNQHFTYQALPQDQLTAYWPSVNDTQRNTAMRTRITPGSAAIAGLVLEKPKWALVRVVGFLEQVRRGGAMPSTRHEDSPESR